MTRLGASVPGKSHVAKGIPCQDALAHQHTSDGRTIIAVADGVGSEANAKNGASTAVTAAVRALEARRARSTAGEWFQQLLVKLRIRKAPKARDAEDDPEYQELRKQVLSAFENAFAAVEELSKKEGAPLHTYASTLIVVVATKRWVVSGHVGDGGAVVRTLTGLDLLSPPDDNEDYVNTTAVLASRDWRAAYRTFGRRNPIWLAVFSDGIQDAVLLKTGRERTPVVGFFDPIFNHIEANPREVTEKDIEQFLLSAKLSAKDDDKTLVIAQVPQ